MDIFVFLSSSSIFSIFSFFLSPSHSPSLSYTSFFFSVVYFFLSLSVVYFLLTRWREKIRTSTPLHVVNFSEIVAVLAFVASFIYLLGFFGIDFVQSLILRPSKDVFLKADDARKTPCSQALDCASIPQIVPVAVAVAPLKPALKVAQKVFDPPPTEKDEEIIKVVVGGTIPSYSLETKLGDCKRAASIRREALQRVSGKSLEGLPLEGFDYKSILGQCCEMPIGYVTIPVGIAGPIMLDGREFSVPMATTEGCLVASTNRGRFPPGGLPRHGCHRHFW